VRWLIAVLLAAVLMLAGCGSPPSPAGSPRPAGSPSPAGSQADRAPLVGTGKTADLAFTGTTVRGDRFDGTRLRGKPVVLWFWAPWCPTCRAQISTVSRLAEQHQGRVAVVGVGGLDSRSAISELATEIPHVTHLVDAEGAVWKHFRVTAQSTYTVTSADGEIMAEGYLDNGDLVALVDQLAGGR
jgi:thiol-disulfide isomerase/thioredoxin